MFVCFSLFVLVRINKRIEKFGSGFLAGGEEMVRCWPQGDALPWKSDGPRFIVAPFPLDQPAREILEGCPFTARSVTPGVAILHPVPRVNLRNGRAF